MQKPAAPNGKRYMHCLHAFLLSISLSLSFRLYLALLKRTEQSKPVSFLLFLCVALLLINKHALWQGLLNQAPIPRPIPSVPLPLHSTHHLSVHPKRDSATTKRIHTNTRVPAYTQYTAHTHSYTCAVKAKLKLKLRANVLDCVSVGSHLTAHVHVCMHLVYVVCL